MELKPILFVLLTAKQNVTSLYPSVQYVNPAVHTVEVMKKAKTTTTCWLSLYGFLTLCYFWLKKETNFEKTNDDDTVTHK